MMVRRICVPRGFPALLPHGPMNQSFYHDAAGAASIASAPSVASLDVDEEYPRLVQLVEKQLCEIAGFDADNAEKACGRANGPKIAYKFAIES